MNDLYPINQTKLFGLSSFIHDLIELYNQNQLPNKILLNGQKGLGKSTMAYHFINYVLSKNEEFAYDINNLKINIENRTYKTILNKSNPNFTLIDIDSDKKMIDINQIRELIKNLNKSSFNTKPRFVLIDNVEYLNINSVNALLKSIEEPSDNVYFILINNYKKVLSTLSSRCINFKIFLSNKEILDTTNKILDDKLELTINRDLINYYSTPGNIYNLVKFAKINEIDLLNLNLQDFLRIIIKENYYKKDNLVRYLIFDLIEFYFIKLSSSFSRKVNDKYMYFLRRISDTKKFNLDEETLFIEFEKEILDG